MALKKNAAGQQLYVLWDTNKNVEVKRNQAFRAEGLDPGYAYYEMHELRVPRNPDGTPQIDEVYHYIQPSAGKLDTTGAEPIFVEAEEIATRPAEEVESLLKSIRNQKARENVNADDQLDRVTRAVYTLIRKTNGITITPREQAELDKFAQQGAVLWENDAVLKAKLTAVSKGQKPDPSEGYTPEGPVA